MKDLRELRHLFACTFLFHFSSFMVIPSITDITVEALCPGRDQCSLAIYLSGLQQMRWISFAYVSMEIGQGVLLFGNRPPGKANLAVITGLGTLMVTPYIGNLSDRYGRKALLTLPMTTAIIPLVILAYDRSRTYFYIYYITKTFTGIFCEGNMHCLSLAYVADMVSERRRAAAFGVLSGVSAAGFVSGTVFARFLSTASTFQVSATVSVFAAAYMRLFLAETDSGAAAAGEAEASRPLCSPPCSDGESSPRLRALRKLPSLENMISILRSSMTLSRAAIVVFFNILAESGLQSAILYYLKAQFQFSKDQFADLLLIIGIAGAFSQLFLMHLLIPVWGEEKLLNIGLLASCAHVFLYGIAWSYWVPYLAAIFIVLSVFIQPCIRSIVSKKVGPNEQGMAQGCITGISSLATIVSPLVFTPLTAWFLSEDAPFKFKGFSIMCVGFTSLIAFMLSINMRSAPPSTSQKLVNAIHVLA